MMDDEAQEEVERTSRFKSERFIERDKFVKQAPVGRSWRQGEGDRGGRGRRGRMEYGNEFLNPRGNRFPPSSDDRRGGNRPGDNNNRGGFMGSLVDPASVPKLGYFYEVFISF